MLKFLALLPLLMLVSCKKEKKASTETIMDPIPVNAVQLVSGSFQNGPYGNVSGLAKIIKQPSGDLEIVLDAFMSSNGPDLYVYLSKEIMPVNFIEAGKLRSTNGTQVYPLSGMPDFAEYRYVCIHCKAFNHLFGWALLQ